MKESEIKNCLTEMFEADVPAKDIASGINGIEKKLKQEQFSFELVRSGGGYQFLTKPAYQARIGIMLKQQSKLRL